MANNIEVAQVIGSTLRWCRAHLAAILGLCIVVTMMIPWMRGESLRSPMGQIQLSDDLIANRASALRLIPIGTEQNHARALLERDGFQTWMYATDTKPELQGYKKLRFSSFDYTIRVLLAHGRVSDISVSRMAEGSI